MGEDIFNLDDEVSKMFINRKSEDFDEELALHLIHRFNICRDTLDTMPAFEKHLDPLFSKSKEK